MSELTKLEVGKTYVFKDETSKEYYLTGNCCNTQYCEEFYDKGFKLDNVETSPYKDYVYGMVSGAVVIDKDEMKYFKLKEENVMPIKPEDEVTITTTYRELARLYVIMGKCNGDTNGELFVKLKSLLDIGGDKYDKLIRPMSSARDILNYNEYQSKWEGMLFGEQETQQQIQIRELREQAEALLQKAKELEGTK